MPALRTAALLRALGVRAVDAAGNPYRVIVGEPDRDGLGPGYGLAAAEAIPDGTMLTIPGLTGEWRVSRSDDRMPDGFWRGVIS